MGNNKSGLEIERRWLLKNLPDTYRIFSHQCQLFQVDQYYLPEKQGRIRRMYNQISVPTSLYYHTIKTPIEGTFAMREDEREISEDEFKKMYLTAERVIQKMRYKMQYGDLVFEIDEFKIPSSVIIMEVEIPSEDHPVEIPEWIKPEIIKEITGDDSFSNFRLSMPI